MPVPTPEAANLYCNLPAHSYTAKNRSMYHDCACSLQAPVGWRGALGSCYAASLGAGLAVAAAANFAIGKIHTPWAWRLAFALESAPAVVVLGAGWALPDTPNSILQRCAASSEFGMNEGQLVFMHAVCKASVLHDRGARCVSTSVACIRLPQ